MDKIEIQQEAEKLLTKKLYRKNTIIENPLAFRPEYFPQDLFVREEIDMLFEDITDYINYNTPGSMLLLGKPGSGKTASLKFLEKALNKIEEVSDSFIVKYINCRNKTAHDIMSELTGNLKPTINIGLLFKVFFERMDKNVILFLDEIDTPNDQREIRDLLYTLSRPSESIPGFELENTTKLVLASNNLNWSNKLDPAVSSSLSMKTHNFSPYNKKQLIEILSKRCQEGLYDSNCISKEIFRKIAQKTVDGHNGDARYAIKVLFYAAKEVEREGLRKISMEHIEKVYPFAEKEIENEGVVKLNDKVFLVLYAAIKSKDKRTTSVYDTYCNLSNGSRMRSVKYTLFHHYMQYLENQNAIMLYKDKNVKIKTLSIEVLIPKGIIEDEFGKRKMRLFSEKKEVSE